MDLPRGITGFNVPRKLAEVDPRSFCDDCWRVVASHHGRVEDRPQVLAPKFTSFITQVLVLPTFEVTALLNKVYPWIGFCRPLEPGDLNLVFVDPGGVASALAEVGRYHVLSRAELEEPVSEVMCKGLGRAEKVEFKYWSRLAEPRRLRVGEVIFNFWD